MVSVGALYFYAIGCSNCRLQGRQDEAKQWLQKLPRARAEGLAAALAGGKLKGTGRGTVVNADLGGSKPKLPEGDRPFAHPAFWAAFTLVGDSD